MYDLSLPHLFLWKLNKPAALNKGSRGAPTSELRMLKHGGMRCGRIEDTVCTIIRYLYVDSVHMPFSL